VLRLGGLRLQGPSLQAPPAVLRLPLQVRRAVPPLAELPAQVPPLRGRRAVLQLPTLKNAADLVLLAPSRPNATTHKSSNPPLHQVYDVAFTGD
jgi:hypothetical protein